MQRLNSLTAILASTFLFFACTGKKATNESKDSSIAKISNDTPMRSDNAGSSNHPSDTNPSFDTNRFTHMRDSMMTQMKAGLGKNSGALDSMMSMLKSQSSGTHASSSPHADYDAKYMDELPNSYIIPVTGSGPMLYYEYGGGTQMNGKKDGLWQKVYVNPTTRENGWNVYIESYMKSSALGINVHGARLCNAAIPKHILLNENYKTYNGENDGAAEKSATDIKITKIGTEKIYGYTCVHVRVSEQLHAFGKVAPSTFDLWCSADVPGAAFLTPRIMQSFSPETEKELSKAGCTGVLIKMTSGEKSGFHEILQLTSITRKDMPDSLFSIPAGYKEDKNTALYDIVK